MSQPWAEELAPDLARPDRKVFLAVAIALAAAAFGGAFAIGRAGREEAAPAPVAVERLAVRDAPARITGLAATGALPNLKRERRRRSQSAGGGATPSPAAQSTPRPAPSYSQPASPAPAPSPAPRPAPAPSGGGGGGGGGSGGGETPIYGGGPG